MTEHGPREVNMGRGDSATYGAGNDMNSPPNTHITDFAERLSEMHDAQYIVRKRIEIRTIITEIVYETKV
jgi:hypothetical protein